MITVSFLITKTNSGDFVKIWTHTAPIYNFPIRRILINWVGVSHEREDNFESCAILQLLMVNHWKQNLSVYSILFWKSKQCFSHKFTFRCFLNKDILLTDGKIYDTGFVSECQTFWDKKFPIYHSRKTITDQSKLIRTAMTSEGLYPTELTTLE